MPHPTIGDLSRSLKLILKPHFFPDLLAVKPIFGLRFCFDCCQCNYGGNNKIPHDYLLVMCGGDLKPCRLRIYAFCCRVFILPFVTGSNCNAALLNMLVILRQPIYFSCQSANFVDLLRHKYSDPKMDVVVGVDDEAADILLGYRDELIGGESLVGIVPERTRNAIMFDVRQLKRWCLMRVTRFRGRQGGVIISHADITERNWRKLSCRMLIWRSINTQSSSKIWLYMAIRLYMAKPDPGHLCCC